ncbi:hypothetical protein AM1BK_33360 [Neobacillus kokaensis]|uniref:Uncharacterized protein n=1 Tax=Neobacillus kokaensis TaxID=2759023 RepID=A0ABQ3N734_9BACI|nr:hypothetical protein AM1BK_33360 [Neobacillus kokaensis]
MYLEEAYEAEINGDFPINCFKKIKSKDLDHINGKTSFIFKEIWVFANLNGIFPFIFQTQ